VVVFTAMHAADATTHAPDAGTVLPMDIVSCMRWITKVTWRLLWTCLQPLLEHLTFNQEAGEKVSLVFEVLSPALWTAAAVFVSVYRPTHTAAILFMVIPIAVLTAYRTAQSSKSMCAADDQILKEIISFAIILAWTVWNTVVLAVTLLFLHHYGMGLVYLTLLVLGLFLFNVINQNIFAPVEPALIQVANGPSIRHGAVKKSRSARTDAIILSWDTIMRLVSVLVFLYAFCRVTHTALDNKSLIKVVANFWLSDFMSSAHFWNLNTTACYRKTYDGIQCEKAIQYVGCLQVVTLLKPIIGGEKTDNIGNFCYYTSDEWDTFFGRSQPPIPDAQEQSVRDMWEYMTTTFPGWHDWFTSLQASATTIYAKCTMANIKSVTIADILAFILDIPLAFLHGIVQVMESLIVQIRPQ